MTTLSDIRLKVRRLTGRPSDQSITDAQIDDYVNTFYLYDMPEDLRLFSLQTNFSFVCERNVDEYDLTNIQVEVAGGATDSALNVYYNISPPFYIAGYEVDYHQDQTGFFRIWNKVNQITTTVTGNGTPGPYAFTLSNVPVYQRQVFIGAIDNTGATVAVQDIPTNRTTGTWALTNTTTAVVGSINYVTGAGTITFSNAIPAGNEITISSVPYVAGRPVSVLFYDNKITLRPAPDKEYTVETQAYKLPTALLNGADNPALKQWWQYLAYGASKKIFEDSQDPEGVAAIMQEMKHQELLVGRRTIGQMRNQRTATIYSDANSQGFGNYYPNRF
ncbi:MAG: hypothetical protein PVF65_12095 [Sphingomonadales bacterium]|jgi:hypothetical protein